VGVEDEGGNLGAEGHPLMAETPTTMTPTLTLTLTLITETATYPRHPHIAMTPTLTPTIADLYLPSATLTEIGMLIPIVGLYHLMIIMTVVLC
jgi:hypothetical protein